MTEDSTTNPADLAARLTALEQRVAERLAPRQAARGGRHFGWLLLAALITLNAGIAWMTLRLLATSRLEHHFWVVCHGGATDQQRREAFTTLVGAGNCEWRSARLQYLKLRHTDLRGAQLEMADLGSCDLTQSSLAGANLQGANLQTATLTGADLSSALLAEAFLREADLTGANASLADFRSASLDLATLARANLQGANLSETSLVLAVLSEANLRNANLAWADLEAADLQGADLHGANLENASIRDTLLADSNWWRAVGLRSDMIRQFQEQFAPSEDARPDWQEDYRRWLDEQQGMADSHATDEDP